MAVLGTSRFCLAATLMLYQSPVLTHGRTELVDSLGGELSPFRGPAGLSGAADITPPWQAFPTPQPEFTCPVPRGAASHQRLGPHASHGSTASPALQRACGGGCAERSLDVPSLPARGTHPRHSPNHWLTRILLYQCQEKTTGSNNPILQKVLKPSIHKHTRSTLCRSAIHQRRSVRDSQARNKVSAHSQHDVFTSNCT